MNKLQAMPALIIVLCLLLTACGSNEIPDAKNKDIQNFTYTDQDGNSFSKEDLKGKVWLADFIFTSCATVCPPMTANMAKLQNMLKEKGIKNVEIVSFSVDPEIDTPKALKEYGSKFQADLSKWHFLTGYQQADIEQFALESFETLVKKPENETQVIHGTSFFLIDQNGKLIKAFPGNKDVPFEEIIKHIDILQK
ncbi:SCO family protein [Peribacillus sp. SCS-155]|uniref:SCO family protein n=1 Tax=Peribacillus sedimenti TaxID=3115297 RepID=UPI0039061EFD